MSKINIRIDIWVLLLFLILVIIYSCRSSLNLGKNGKIENGKVYPNCTKPEKRYAKSVEIALNGSIKNLNNTNTADLNSSVVAEVNKLTDYSQQGLDLDLILFRLCEMANNRTLTPEQAQSLFSQAIKAWKGHSFKRHIPEDKRKGIIELLTSAGIHSIKFEYSLGDNEVAVFANEIMNIFQESGWTFSYEMYQSIAGDDAKGIVIYCKDKLNNPSYLIYVINLFKYINMNVTLIAQPSLKADEIIVHIAPIN